MHQSFNQSDNFEQPEQPDEITTTIEGVKYAYLPLMAKQARDILLKLVNKLGPVFGEGVSKVGESKNILDMDIGDGEDFNFTMEMVPALAGSFGTMIIKFCQAINPSFYAGLCDTFLPRITRYDPDGRQYFLKEKQREIFARKLLLEARLVAWGIEQQYSDFFELWKSDAIKNLSHMMKTQGPQSDSQQPLTGGSTE